MIDKIEGFVREFCEQELMEAAREGREGVVVDFRDLERHDPTLADTLLSAPKKFFGDLDEVLDEFEMGVEDPPKINVRFANVPEEEEIRIKDLRSEHIGKFIKLDGVVKKATEVMPEVREAIFECPDCGERHSVLQKRKKLTYPNQCSCGRKRGFRVVDRELHDVRYVALEDNFEETLGEQPGEITVILKDDLTTPEMQKATDPGTELKISGMVKEKTKRQNGKRTKQMEMIMEANHIEHKQEDFQEIDITEEEEERIKEFSQREDVFDILIRSVAPSMYGLEDIKEAVILQLFGGSPQMLPDGTRIRGDIHILLVGDPSVGKTQLLKLVTQFMPRGKYVSGKGTTAAGLTATVVREEEFGGWVLEAGAVVLTNKSVLAIDEFDKMSKEDQINLHEAMSTQTVSISKANIQATMPAQTAILAGCNPKFSRFDPTRDVVEQIDIPDTLMSRFDLKFVLRDEPDEERDEQMAEHVIKTRLDREDVEPEMDTDFLKKYIAYARGEIEPEISRKAAAMFKNFFVNLRSRQAGEGRPIPITLRQYEALMRLAEASARVRLSEEVEEEDAQRAIRLMKKSIKQLGYDPESEEFDIDKAEGGTSAKERNKLTKVMETIEELEDQFGKTIPEQEIFAELEDQGMNQAEVGRILRELKRRGTLFEPRSGKLRKI